MLLSITNISSHNAGPVTQKLLMAICKWWPLALSRLSPGYLSHKTCFISLQHPASGWLGVIMPLYGAHIQVVWYAMRLAHYEEAALSPVARPASFHDDEASTLGGPVSTRLHKEDILPHSPVFRTSPCGMSYCQGSEYCQTGSICRTIHNQPVTP